MSDLFLHLGYPKTATTTFQQHVFPKQPGLVYLGKLIPSFRYTDPTLFPLIDALMTTDSVSYEGVDALREAIRRHRDGAEGRPLLISSESFLHVTATDAGVVAARVQAAFSPCKVIITIREQRSLLRSFYGRHGRFGHYLFVVKPELEPFVLPLSFDHWLTLCCRAPNRNLPALLHYDRVVSHYSELLGPDNVGVFLFEELERAPEAYAGRLGGFLGVDPDAMHQLLRGRHELSGLARGELWGGRINRLLARAGASDTIERGLASPLGRWLGRSLPVADPMSPEWEHRLSALYGPGNRRLAQISGLSLGEYGYAGC